MNEEQNELENEEISKDDISADNIAESVNTNLDVGSIVSTNVEIKKTDDMKSGKVLGEIYDVLEELAEDMTHLIKSTSTIEKTLTDFSDKNFKQYQNHAKDLARLRNELMEDKKTTLSGSIFKAIAPVVDSLNQMLANVCQEKDQSSYNYIASVLSMQKNILRSLGYEEFSPEIGEDFDPNSMECIDKKGEDSSKVSKVVSLGYKSPVSLVKPASVILD